MVNKELNELSHSIASEFKEILTHECFSGFSVVEDEDDVIGQVFSLEIFYSEEYFGHDGLLMGVEDIILPILKFQHEDELMNDTLDINRFFEINEEIFSMFDEFAGKGELNALIPLLKEGNLINYTKDIGQAKVDTMVFLSLNSNVEDADNFKYALLDEGIATIGLNETDEIDLGCVLSERKAVTITHGEKSVELNLPFEILKSLNIL